MANEREFRLERAEMEKILAGEENGCLCLSKNGEPYAVPISYAWIDGQIVCHCSFTGEKINILNENPRVCFVVFRYPTPIKPHEGKCDFNFESVLCFGKVRELTDLDERHKVLIKFRNHFYSRLNLPPKGVTPAEAKKTNCIVITVERMTGRQKTV